MSFQSDFFPFSLLPPELPTKSGIPTPPLSAIAATARMPIPTITVPTATFPRVLAYASTGSSPIV